VNIQGLTINPLDSVLIGISNSVLFKIDPIVGGLLPIVTIPVGNLRAIAYSSSGTLFAGTKSGVLYRIDINTGEATQVGTSSGKSYSSFSFNSQDGKLYASVAPFVGALKDAIYTVDTLSGAVTLIGLTGDGKGTPSIAFNRDGTLYGLKGTGNEVNRLISINTINGSGTEIGTLGQSNLQAIIMTEIITGIDEDDNLILTSYELFQNYPNPFNPSSVISYQLPVGGDVTLKIYDVLGNEIATLVNEYKPAGKYEVEFSAASLPSGVYFYQLKAGSFVETKKMLLLK
jgi:hypothetical protein